MELHDIIYEKYRALNKIHGVMLEVTHRCPCDCVHCFLVKDPAGELTLDEITGLFAQLREEGAINIGISGGEPFLRNDLPAILASARKNGLFVSLLTTAIYIERPEVMLLKKLSIYNIEISLLGAKPETHDSVMRYDGAFDHTMNAVKLLRAEGINVMMKATLLEQNYKELEAMAELCRSLKVGFSANVLISPGTDGNLRTQGQMLTMKELSDLNPDYIDAGLIPGESAKEGALLVCSAGKTSAGISPQGDIYPCIILREKIGNIREKTLKDIWHDHPAPFLTSLRETRQEDVLQCFACEARTRCRRCPGNAYLETGSHLMAPPSACHIALKIKE
jgi:radical SAM protein with 4Fe4S-binding SPASM domain